jgi:hypothetical protein
MELVGSWVSETGEQPAALSTERHDTGISGYRQWLAELDLSGRPAGTSRLRLELVDKASGRAVASTETDLRIDT